MRRAFNKVPKNSHIQLSVSMWTKDSHGLYDYQADSEQIHHETFYLENDCTLLRDPMNSRTLIQIPKENSKIEEQKNIIATLTINRQNTPNIFKIKPLNIQQQDNQDLLAPFVVIKDFSKDSNKGYPLQPGNVIKLGRVQFMVIQVKNNHDTVRLRDTNHFDQVNGTFEPTLTTCSNSQNSCKICLSDQQNQYNPLISPCKCKGSCSLIHVECLKTWINSKVKKQLHTLATSYNFTKFQCEICKSPFPNFIKLADKDIQMMSITKPDKPYIILESLPSKSQTKQQKCLHLISTDENNPLKIGRGHTSEIRVTDISVSRNHAEIVFQNNNFYLRDLGSKFGTLVKFKGQLQINSQQTIKLQYGRALVQFKLQPEPELDVDTEEEKQ